METYWAIEDEKRELVKDWYRQTPTLYKERFAKKIAKEWTTAKEYEGTFKAVKVRIEKVERD